MTMNLKDLVDGAQDSGEHGDPDTELPELDERFDRYAEGSLSPDELRELESEAADNELMRDALELFEPLGEDFEAEAAERMAELMKPLVRESRTSGSEVPGDSSLRGSMKRFLRGVGVLVPVAALGVLMMVMVGLPAASPPGIEGVELDGWDLAVRGAPQEGQDGVGSEGRAHMLREGQDQGRVFTEGNLFEMDIRLAEGTGADNVTVHCYIDSIREDAAVDIPVRAAGDVLRLSEKVGQGALALEPGEHRVIVLVGPSGKSPNLNKAAAAYEAGRAGYGSWQLLSTSVRVKPKAD